MTPEITALVVPVLSALVGGVASYLGAHQAMKIELAILRTRVDALERVSVSQADDIDAVHRRIDDVLHNR